MEDAMGGDNYTLNGVAVSAGVGQSMLGLNGGYNEFSSRFFQTANAAMNASSWSLKGGNLILEGIFVPGYCPTGAKCGDAVGTFLPNSVTINAGLIFSGGQAANNGGIDWTWVKTFVKEAVQPWKELKKGGCGNEFLSAFSDGGIVSAVSDNLDGGPGTGPDDVIKQAGTIAAAQYVVNQGLAVPLRSSIYRGILSGTETAAGSFVVADAYTRIGQGYYAEYKSFKAGGCH
jgi:hypothetical protein